MLFCFRNEFFSNDHFRKMTLSCHQRWDNIYFILFWQLLFYYYRIIVSTKVIDLFSRTTLFAKRWKEEHLHGNRTHFISFFFPLISIFLVMFY